MTEHKVEILSRQTAYKGYFRIDSIRLRHSLFAGGMSPELTREVFERGHAVAGLLYDPDADAVVLVEQFRVGAWSAGMPAWELECIAGIIEDGETPEAVVRREAEEESGLVVGDVVPVARYLSSPGGSSETVEVFCARVDSRHAGGIHGLPEEGEDIRVVVLPYAELERKVFAGGIGNAMTLIAAQWLVLNRAELRRLWPKRP
ncbi:NUDIX domain-containing protein [Caenispirillum bisanense]|uniref:NUDIX domain-containing protein n=1 Tax=Caenispirillum bisanense TaxID=414052 RepID=UPI0031D04C21